MVITSSVAAVRSEHPSGPRHQGGPPYTFTEEDWNEDSVATVEKEGTAAPGQEKYRASKVRVRFFILTAMTRLTYSSTDLGREGRLG